MRSIARKRDNVINLKGVFYDAATVCTATALSFQESLNDIPAHHSGHASTTGMVAQLYVLGIFFLPLVLIAARLFPIGLNPCFRDMRLLRDALK